MNAVCPIAIVGHSDLVRKGLEHIFENRPEYEVLLSTELSAGPEDADAGVGGGVGGGLFAEIDAAVAGGTPAKLVGGLPPPDPEGVPVILLGLPGRATGAQAKITELSAAGRILYVGEFSHAQQLNDVMTAGAFGCVSDLVDEEELLLAVRTVARGGMHISPSLSELLHSSLREPEIRPPKILAPRETEALGWLAVGLTHREIARRMGLTEATVSTYVKRIRSKLNARNKAELTRVAVELGLLGLERPAMSGERPAPGL